MKKEWDKVFEQMQKETTKSLVVNFRLLPILLLTVVTTCRVLLICEKFVISRAYCHKPRNPLAKTGHFRAKQEQKNDKVLFICHGTPSFTIMQTFGNLGRLGNNICPKNLRNTTFFLHRHP